jgi:hypothetical protein
VRIMNDLLAPLSVFGIALIVLGIAVLLSKMTCNIEESTLKIKHRYKKGRGIRRNKKNELINRAYKRGWWEDPIELRRRVEYAAFCHRIKALKRRIESHK